MKLPPFVHLPPHADLFGWTAHTLLDAAADRLPDLGGITLILPHAAGIAALRKALLREAGRPLLGPDLTTLDAYLCRGADRAPLSALDGRLLLTELLSQSRHPFAQQDPWPLAAELFNLFEELSAHAPALATDDEGFRAGLERGYGRPPPAALSQEAAVVHQLWRAYLQDTRDRSPAVASINSLKRMLAARRDDERVLLIGCDALPAALLAVLAPHVGQGVHVWTQGEAMESDGSRWFGPALTPGIPASSSAAALWRAFDGAGSDPRERRADTPLPLRTVAARHAEHEARTVDLAIREAWLRGERDIVVVTEDRRLARRLRALLERAGIGLRDEVGWALSTSAAAASLGHWLDGIERDFPYRETLALLKSAFFGADSSDLATLERWVYEQGYAGSLLRLKSETALPTAPLRLLEQAARLLPDPQSAARAAGDWSGALLRSLQALPLWTRWTQDRAGERLIAALEELDAALRASALRCGWREFRTLLESLIERQTFLPEAGTDGVRLMTLQQATGLRCGLLIVAGASAAQFPGRAAAQGLFMHEVRAALGLPHWTQQLALQRSRFVTLLHAAPDLLITYAPDDPQTRAIPCPWVQWLQALNLVWSDEALAARAADPRSEITAIEPWQLSPPVPAAAAGLDELLPKYWSASAHQALVDCPYRFHARHALRLDAREAPDRAPDARDYGDLVHKILQAFHERMPGLPAPYDGDFDDAQRPHIEAHLRRTAAAVFAPELRRRALARVWAARFDRAVADLARWLCERARDWPDVRVEQKLRRALADGLMLQGTVDRLEQNARGELSVVDYKTGRPPHGDEVRSGENVQATHYALLDERVVQVEYLDLAFDGRRAAPLSGTALDEVRTQVAQRLSHVATRLHAGAAAPANGAEAVCERCDYAGLCRKGGWRE